jgi:AP-3 complex subunit beta
MLVTLLKTSTPVTIGATLQAVDSICPDHLDLLHPYYRKICMLLIDSDEWGQVVVLAVLQRYVRNYLEKPEEQEVHKAGVNKQHDDQTPDSTPNHNDQSRAVSEALPESSSAPRTRNPAVTLAAIRLFYLCASSQVSSEDLSQHKIIAPLLRLCSVTQDTSEVAWSAWEIVREIAEQRPASLFACCSSLTILGPIDADRAV